MAVCGWRFTVSVFRWRFSLGVLRGLAVNALRWAFCGERFPVGPSTIGIFAFLSTPSMEISINLFQIAHRAKL